MSKESQKTWDALRAPIERSCLNCVHGFTSDNDCEYTNTCNSPHRADKLDHNPSGPNKWEWNGGYLDDLDHVLRQGLPLPKIKYP